MKINLSCVMAGLALSFAVSPSFAQNTLDTQPGLWEYRMETKMVGMPVAIPPQTFRRCLTAQDVAQNKHLTGEQGKNPCTLSNFKAGSGKVSFDFLCKSEQGSIKGSSSGSASASSLDFETRLQMIPPQQGMSEMTQKMVAKRVGNC